MDFRTLTNINVYKRKTNNKQINLQKLNNRQDESDDEDDEMKQLNQK